MVDNMTIASLLGILGRAPNGKKRSNLSSCPFGDQMHGMLRFSPRRLSSYSTLRRDNLAQWERPTIRVTSSRMWQLHGPAAFNS